MRRISGNELKSLGGPLILLVTWFQIVDDMKTIQSLTYKPGLCLLHSESPISDPSLLVEGDGKTMVIENGCEQIARISPALISMKADQSGYLFPKVWNKR